MGHAIPKSTGVAPGYSRPPRSGTTVYASPPPDASDVVEPVALVDVVRTLHQVVLGRALGRGDERPRLALVGPVRRDAARAPRATTAPPPRGRPCGSRCSPSSKHAAARASSSPRGCERATTSSGDSANGESAPCSTQCDDRGAVVLGVVGDLLHLASASASIRSGRPSGMSMSRSGLRSTDAPSAGRTIVPRLVDPHRHRDVDEAEQLVGHVGGVDQARMRRRRGVDPLVRVLAARCRARP